MTTIDRPPRIQPQLPSNTIEVPAPPEQSNNSRIQLIQIGLPLLTILGYVLISTVGGVGRSPWMLVPMSLSVVASALFGVYMHRREKSLMQARLKAYADSISDMHGDMQNSHEQQRSFYRYNYPTATELLLIAKKSKETFRTPTPALRAETRLWERRSSDVDFGVMHIGIGSIPSTVVYTIDNDFPVNSPHARAAVQLAERSRYVTDIPVAFSIRNPALSGKEFDDDDVVPRFSVSHAFALVGKSAEVYKTAQAMLGHAVVFHAPTDLQIQVLSRQSQQWDWVKGVKHCRGNEQAEGVCFEVKASDNDQSVQQIFLKKESTKYEQFLEDIRRNLTQRQLRLQQQERDDTAESPSLPQLLLLVDLLDLNANDANDPLARIEAEAAISIALEQGLQLGAAVMFLVSERSKVPSGCTSVIEIEASNELSDPRSVFRYSEVGINTPRYVGFADQAPQLENLAELAKEIAPLELRQAAQSGLPRSVPFLELMGWDSLEMMKQVVSDLWQNSTKTDNINWLKVPIGKLVGDKVRSLELSASADGVHGMVAGGTGSGKSELLISLICGLASIYEPRLLNVVLVDFKGGSTFEAFRRLPHCVDMFSNLEADGEGVSRMFVAIQAELERRQRLLKQVNASTIVDYNRKMAPQSCLPFLLIVIDEFVEMLNAHTQSRAQLESVTRIGRSLGVHLILASQRLSQVSDQMRANIKLRLCLRVEGESDSREILGRSDAAFLPSGMPGRGYLQGGNDALELVQIAYTGNYESGLVPQVKPPVLWLRHQLPDSQAVPQDDALYRVLIEQYHKLAKDQQIPTQRAPWPRQLPRSLNLEQTLVSDNPDLDVDATVSDKIYFDEEDLKLIRLNQQMQGDISLNPAVPAWFAKKHFWDLTTQPEHLLQPVIGLADDPTEALHRPLIVNLQQGHALLFGAPGYGKSMFLRTLALSLAATHSPNVLHLYGVDMGGRGLEPLRSLPHTGDVIAAVEEDFEERVIFLFQVLRELLAERKKRFAEFNCDSWLDYQRRANKTAMPAVLVMFDNIAELQRNDKNQDEDELSLVDQLLSIVRQARTYGLFFVFSANKLADVPTALLSLCSERFCLNLLEPSDYRAILSGQIEHIPNLPGRGYTNVEQKSLAFQVALPVEKSDKDDFHRERWDDLANEMTQYWESLTPSNLGAEPPRKIEPLIASITLPKLLGLPEPKQADFASKVGQYVKTAWQESLDPSLAKDLEATIARGLGNQNRTLCFAADADGVHAMVAGGTGSGKSELLMSLILSLAMKYDPTVLNFVLVDYKGGGAFKPFEHLPHCVDVQTNLNTTMVQRMFTALNAELNRRQLINQQQKADNLVTLRKNTPKNQAPLYPHLLIIIDEFAEMITDNPDFRMELDRIARVGRSVGVNMLLASQRPTGITDQMRANISLSICLRVPTPDISREILRRPDAALLPSDRPGRGYIQVGSQPLELTQIAYAGEKVEIAGEKKPVYQMLVELLSEQFKQTKREKPQAPWPPVLPPILSFNDSLSAAYLSEQDITTLRMGKQNLPLRLNSYVSTNWTNWPKLDWQHALKPVVGLIDTPSSGTYRPFVVDLQSGHSVIIGAEQWGKSTFLRAIALSISATHSPKDVHIHMLDLGNGDPLAALAELPQVGTLISSNDASYAEQVQQLWHELEQEIERRRNTFKLVNVDDFGNYKKLPPEKQEPLPAVLVLIDNFAEFLDTFSSSLGGEEDNRLKELTQLLKAGRSYGLYFVITADRPGTLPPKLYTLLPNRYSLRLNDINDYSWVVGAPVEFGNAPVGHGVVRMDRVPQHFQIAVMPGAIQEKKSSNSLPSTEVVTEDKSPELIRNFVERLKLKAADQPKPLKIQALPVNVSGREIFNEAFGLRLSKDAPFADFETKLRAVVRQRWHETTLAENSEWLRVPIARGAGGVIRELKLEATLDGVHGIIAGGTGSGKSEALMMLVVSLALHYDPSILNFVLVDYKGGGAFKPFERLPHCVDLVTNLDTSAVDRMFTAITAEIKTRQALIAETNTKSIVEYREKGLHITHKRFPHLFVIIDEYAEMIDDNPDYKAQLESIARVGRSIGINLLLAAQRPKGVTDQMRANMKLRLCLKVEETDTSRELLQRPDAAYLPNGLPGRGFLQAGNREIEMIQFGYVGAKVDDTKDAAHQYERLVAMMADLHQQAVPRPWPQSLPPWLSLDTQLLDKDYKPFALKPELVQWRSSQAYQWKPPVAEEFGQAIIALQDLPFAAKQQELKLDVLHNHTAVFGNSQSGKTSLLKTLIMSLAADHAPNQMQIYVVDFVGNGFNDIAELPHVGVVLEARNPHFDELLRRLLERLEQQIDAAQQQLQQLNLLAYNTLHPDNPIPATVVIMDGASVLRERYDTLVENMIVPIMSRSLAVGISFVFAQPLVRHIPTQLYPLCSTRLSLYQTTTEVYADIIGRNAVAFAQWPGRGYILSEDKPTMFQAAQLLTDDKSPTDADTAISLEQIIARMQATATQLGISPIPPLQVLPSIVPLEQVLRESQGQVQANHKHISAIVGLRDDLKPFELNLSLDGPHFLVNGSSFAGKTTVLHTLILSLAKRYIPERLAFVLVDPTRNLFQPHDTVDFATLPHVLACVLDADELMQVLKKLQHEAKLLRSHSSSRSIVVCIDNFEDLISDLDTKQVAEFADLSRKYGRDGIHMVIASSFEPNQSANEWRKRIQNVGFAFALRDEIAFEAISRLRKPTGLAGRELPQGRGYVIRKSQTNLVQWAIPTFKPPSNPDEAWQQLAEYLHEVAKPYGSFRLTWHPEEPVETEKELENPFTQDFNKAAELVMHYEYTNGRIGEGSLYQQLQQACQVVPSPERMLILLKNGIAAKAQDEGILDIMEFSLLSMDLRSAIGNLLAGVPDQERVA